MKNKKRIVIVVAYILLVVCIFYPFMNINGEYHNILYLLKSLNSMEIEEFVSVNNIVTNNAGMLKLNALGEIIAMLLAVVFGLIKVILVFAGKKENNLFRYLFLLVAFVGMYFNARGYGIREISEEIQTLIIPAIPFWWAGIVFLGEMFYDELTSRKEKK